MSRPVPEWIGKSDTTAIPPRVKARIALAQDGVCNCGCGVKLGQAGERIDFDHIQALILGGENRESNLQALRYRCHKTKTSQDVKQKSKEARVRNKHNGFTQPKAKIQGSKGTPFKKKVSGEIIKR